MKTVQIVTHSSNDHARRVGDAIALANSAQNYFHLLSPGEIDFPSQGDEVNPEEARDVLVSSFPAQPVIAITSLPFDVLATRS